MITLRFFQQLADLDGIALEAYSGSNLSNLGKHVKGRQPSVVASLGPVTVFVRKNVRYVLGTIPAPGL